MTSSEADDDIVEYWHNQAIGGHTLNPISISALYGQISLNSGEVLVFIRQIENNPPYIIVPGYYVESRRINDNVEVFRARPLSTEDKSVIETIFKKEEFKGSITFLLADES